MIRRAGGAFVALGAAFALLSASACGSQVVGGGSGGSGGSGGASSSQSSGTASSGSGGPAGNAIAMFYSQFPPDSSGSSGTTTGTGGPMIDPLTLYVFLGNFAIQCSAPFDSACPSWHVTIGFPPALQAPGVYSLGDPALNSHSSISLSPDANGSCMAGGGGSFVDGTIEIVSLTDTDVVVRLSGTSTLEFNADGEYTAIRCP